MPPLPARDLTGFDALYGLEIDQLTDAEVTARVRVRDDLRQPAGLIHGGVLASIAESTTTLATARAVEPDGKTAQGSRNQTSFLRPIVGDTIHAVARRRHRGPHDLGVGGRALRRRGPACARSCG